MKLYWKYMSIHFRCAMQHKASFFMQAFGQFILAFTMVLGVWFLMDRFGLIEGFTAQQVLLCFSMNLCGFTTAELFFRGFDMFPRMVRTGEFDRALLQPRSSILMALCCDASFVRLGRLAQAALVAVLVLPGCGVDWTVEHVLTAILMFAGSAALYAALFLVRATVAFFTIDSIEFMNIFIDGAREFGSYPMSIYGDVILKFTTFLLPLACTQYYPLLFLLGRGPWWYGLLPCAGFVFWLPALVFWRFGVRKYQSTGS